MNRITLPLLLAACSALGAWAVWEHIQRTTLEDRLAELESGAASRAMRGPAEPAKTGGGAKSVRKVPGTGEVAGNGTASDPDSASGPSGGKQDVAGEMAEGFAKMMANPKMRDIMKEQARMGIDQVYRDLYDLLDIKEPQRSKLEKLINEKASVGLEAGFALMDGKKTAEDRKAAAAEVKSKVAELDGQIKDLLGKEDYEKVQRYEKSTIERLQLKAFDSMLTAKEMRLDETTEAKLMDVMYKEREKFPFASNFIDQRNPDIERFTAENAARFNEEYGKLNENVAKQAAGFLSTDQLGILRQSQEQQGNLINMRLGMAARMFGGAGKK